MRSRSGRAVGLPPSLICPLTLDARSPPRSPVFFQADGPKSPVVAGTSQSSLSHRSAVQGRGVRGQSPECRAQSGCRPVWRIAGSEFSVRPKTRDWGVGPWCRERHSGRWRAGGVGGRRVVFWEVELHNDSRAFHALPGERASIHKRGTGSKEPGL